MYGHLPNGYFDPPARQHRPHHAWCGTRASSSAIYPRGAPERGSGIYIILTDFSYLDKVLHGHRNAHRRYAQRYFPRSAQSNPVFTSDLERHPQRLPYMTEVLTGPGFGAFHFSHESTLIPNGHGTLTFTYGRLGHRVSQRHVHSTGAF